MEVGDFIRRKDWECFFPKLEHAYTPVMEVLSVEEVDDNHVRANGYMVNTNDIVTITEKEYFEYLYEFALIDIHQISEKVKYNNHVHINKNTGFPKTNFSRRIARQFVFKFNKNKGLNLRAYKCPLCKEIHCGNAPVQENSRKIHVYLDIDNDNKTRQFKFLSEVKAN